MTDSFFCYIQVTCIFIDAEFHFQQGLLSVIMFKT